MKFEIHGEIAKILPVLAFSAALIGNAHANCRAPIPETGNPEGFSKSVTAKLNPRRFEAASQSKINEIPASEIGESGIIESQTESNWRMGGGDSWKCNFSKFRDLHNEVRFLTAKHCVSNEFQRINSDVWVSKNFDTISVRTRIVEKMESVLESTNTPSNGEPAILSGCIPSSDGCFRIEGKLEDVFEKNGETVQGIWISQEAYSKLVRGRLDVVLEGFSGSPALNAEGKVFWTVSATVAADFRENSAGKCLPANYAIAIAPIKRID